LEGNEAGLTTVKARCWATGGNGPTSLDFLTVILKVIFKTLTIVLSMSATSMIMKRALVQVETP